jgi:hypothetical protein
MPKPSSKPKLSRQEILARSKQAEAQPVMTLEEIRWYLSGFADPPRELSKLTAWRYSRRDDFPPPYALLSVGKVWKTTHVERWQRKHKAPFQVGRKPSKKPKRG